MLVFTNPPRPRGLGFAARWVGPCLVALAALCAASPLQAETSPCDGLELRVLPNSFSRSGWTGNSHGAAIAETRQVQLAVAKRCSDGAEPDGELCSTNQDCAVDETCQATCDCSSDPSCEMIGPVHEQRCLESGVECDTNADCSENDRCAHMFSAPAPTASGGAPTCVVTHFDAPLTGNFDTSTGEVDFALPLRWRIHLGIALAMPCPRCGSLEENPDLGDIFTCEGGPNDGQICEAHALHNQFGGTSHDCPPAVSTNLAGPGFLVKLDSGSTGTIARQATLPCGGIDFDSHPKFGNATCTDDGTPCDSNADCTRCKGDQTIACSSNADCGADAPCAAGPDVAVTCGFYCHCGFCEDDATGIQDGSLPCFETIDCPENFTCTQGVGEAPDPNQAQVQPNGCSSTLCGFEDKEECHETFIGSCSDQPFRTCMAESETCENAGAGTCVIRRRTCFEGVISRTGIPSPLANYCTDGVRRDPCTSNADCSGGECLGGRARPQIVAMFCAPAVSSPVVNAVFGATGPAALTLESMLEVCQCGDGAVLCDEECDDGGIEPQDGCDENCRIEESFCGDGILDEGETCDEGVFESPRGGGVPTGNSDDPGVFCTGSCTTRECGLPVSAGPSPIASDALHVLRGSVGLVPCDVRICDVNGFSGVTAGDALSVLRKTVGNPEVYNCPTELPGEGTR